MLSLAFPPALSAAIIAIGTSMVGASSSPMTAHLAARQYQDINSPLVLDYPACDFYKCAVTWTHGQSTYINWQNAPYGTVNLVLMQNENTEVAFQIANVTSPSQPGYCDAGEGVGVVVAGKECGRFDFIVPTEWQTGKNYSVRAQLLSNTSIESYTDIVQIKKAAGNPEPTYALTEVPISGAPTATTTVTGSDSAGTAGASFTGTNTAPTTPGGSTPTSASNSSSSSTGTGAGTGKGKGDNTTATADSKSNTTAGSSGTNASSTGSSTDSTSSAASIALPPLAATALSVFALAFATLAGGAILL